MFVIINDKDAEVLKVYPLHTFCRDLIVNNEKHGVFKIIGKPPTRAPFICTRFRIGVWYPNDYCDECKWYYHSPRTLHDDMKKIDRLLVKPE